MSLTFQKIEEIAKDRHWKLNSNSRLVEKLIESLNLSIQNFGKPYCPCRIERSEQNICPCQSAPEEIETKNHCHCQLFFKIIKNK